MRVVPIQLLIAILGVLAMLPTVASALSSADPSAGHQISVDAGSAEPDGADSGDVTMHRKSRAAEIREIMLRFRCLIYERHVPWLYERFCASNAPTPTAVPTYTPTPAPTFTPTPEPTPTPIPPSTPTGMADFSGESLRLFFYGVGTGPEFGFDIVPSVLPQGGSEYAWVDGTYDVSFSRSATGTTMLSFTGPGPSQFSMKTLGATCGAWDTVEFAIIHGGEGTRSELRNVLLDGESLGDLVDNGDGVDANEYWTFSGDFSDLSLSADLVVSGWGAESTPRPQVEVTFGCGAP